MTHNIKSTFILLLFTYCLTAQGIDNALYVYDFELNDMPVKERATYLYNQGFKGVTFSVNNEQQLQKLKNYLETDEVQSGKLSIPIVYLVYKFEKKEELDNIWKQILAINRKMPLWVIVRNDDKLATREKTVELFTKMTTEAEKTGSDIVIYPHDNTFIESVEDALPYINEVNKPNLKLSFHLCHEIRAGNGNRLLDVALSAAPYLTFASISGSNISVTDNALDWSDSIKPLDEGDYPVEDFISVLQKIKFKGKMVLHTFGIKDSENHLSRSLTKWNEMLDSTYKDLNTNLNSILDAPENAYWDKSSKSWFISSLGGEKVTIAKDGYGWITRLDENRNVVANRWVEGLDAPTGMASYNGNLYVADRGILVKINISSGKIIEKINLPGSRFPNDVAAAKNGDIYVSDTYENIIYKVNEKGVVEVFIKDAKLECPNGLWVDGNDLIVATWGPMTNEATFETSRKGTVLTINRKTKKITPVGEGKPIANFDGIIKYKDNYYGTDWVGGRLLKISCKGEVTELITGFNQFADLGIDEEKGIIVIPEMSKNRFITINLKSINAK